MLPGFNVKIRKQLQRTNQCLIKSHINLEVMQSLIALSLGNNENVVSNIEKLACCFCFDVYVLSPLCCG